MPFNQPKQHFIPLSTCFYCPWFSWLSQLSLDLLVHHVIKQWWLPCLVGNHLLSWTVFCFLLSPNEAYVLNKLTPDLCIFISCSPSILIFFTVFGIISIVQISHNSVISSFFLLSLSVALTVCYILKLILWLPWVGIYIYMLYKIFI